MATQPHLKLKLNHAANQKSVNLVHGANGPNAMLNAINLGKFRQCDLASGIPQSGL